MSYCGHHTTQRAHDSSRPGTCSAPAYGSPAVQQCWTCSMQKCYEGYNQHKRRSVTKYSGLHEQCFAKDVTTYRTGFSNASRGAADPLAAFADASRAAFAASSSCVARNCDTSEQCHPNLTTKPNPEARKQDALHIPEHHATRLFLSWTTVGRAATAKRAQELQTTQHKTKAIENFTRT